MSIGADKYAAQIPFPVTCHQCKEPNTHKLHLDKTSFDWTCPKCGFTHPSYLGLDVTIGWLLLVKSRHELVNEKDFSMAIVFAAMAFESELSRLFFKWKDIECIPAGTQLGREQCEEQLRNFRTISGKIEGVSRYLVGCGIDDFVSARTHLLDPISTGFKSIQVGSLAADFQQHLFLAAQ